MSDNIENTEDFILWREALDYVTDKNVVDMLVQTIHQLRAEVLAKNNYISALHEENLKLENNQACDVCSPDDYGWQHNAVEGRVPCGCITESGAYQELRADKGELYQMLKAIVDTHRAGYAWMDMAKPQALLDRLEVDQ